VNEGAACCEPDEQAEAMCLACLVRPSRPGSVYCSALCRALHALRIVRLS
jgi:hypothetical protein